MLYKMHLGSLATFAISDCLVPRPIQPVNYI